MTKLQHSVNGFGNLRMRVFLAQHALYGVKL
jgi:hypothetical protein